MMYDYIYVLCVYVGFDYTYIDINELAQGIKSFWASQVWFQTVSRARTRFARNYQPVTLTIRPPRHP